MPDSKPLSAEAEQLIEQAWNEATSQGRPTEERARSIATLIVKDQFGLTRADTLFDSIMEQVLEPRGFTHRKMVHSEPRLSLSTESKEKETNSVLNSPLMGILMAFVFFVVGFIAATAWKNAKQAEPEAEKVVNSSETVEPSTAQIVRLADDSDKVANDYTDEGEVESTPSETSLLTQNSDAERLQELLAGDLSFVKKLSLSEVNLLSSKASKTVSARTEAALLLYADRIGAKTLGKGDFPELLALFADLEWLAEHAPAETFTGKDVLALDRYSRLMLAGRDPDDPSKVVEVGGTLSDSEWKTAKTAIEEAFNTP
jgi:hypothetical protein